MVKQINFNGQLIRQFGAYITTDLSALTAINGVASGIIGVVGLAEKGPVNEPVTITSYIDLVNTFGDGPLVRHGLAMYVGGANTLVCVRTGNPTAASLSTIVINNIQQTLDYRFVARERGTLGNNLSIAVSTIDPDENSNQSNAATLQDDKYRIEIRYIDERGNDVREVFEVPRYIPNPQRIEGFDSNNNPIYSYRYYNNNLTEYYVLRDRETGYIREVPDTWSFGNANKNEFLEKVSQLKSTSEDLIGPFPYGTGTNPYPLAIIQAVINNGSLGFAPSQLVQLLDVSPSAEDLLNLTYDPQNADTLVEHPFLQLSGGSNGDDGTNYYGIYDNATETWDYNVTYNLPNSDFRDTWTESLGVLESEDVNFVQPAYLFNWKGNANQWNIRWGFFKSLMPLFLAHVNSMSNVGVRKFRTMIAGVPYFIDSSKVDNSARAFLREIKSLSGIINSDRVQVWVGGFKSRAFSSGVENYGADMLASFVAGAHASRPVSESLTFARLAGIFTDGLEFYFTHSQRDELYGRSLAFIMKRRNSTGAVEYVAAHNYTSFTGAPNRGLTHFITRRIVDYMNTFVYKNLEENFIGVQARGQETAAAIADFVEALLDQLIREDVLVAVDSIQVRNLPESPNVYEVEYDFQPVSEINFIPVKNRLVYTLA